MSEQIINTRITADTAQAEQAIRTIKRDFKSLGDEARDLISPVNMVKTALASLGAWSGIQGVKSIVDAALAMERLNTQFKVLTGSSALGAAEMRFVSEESKRLGQELVVLAAAYSRLLQATKGTKFEGAPTKAMFSGFSEAFTALKMTSDQMSGVWLQINQGMMKGKIQLEDINIISERGLNIIKLLEISTGKTSKELMDMIGKSKLTADEYMKLGPLLSQIYGGAAKTAAQELQGSINNFSTEFMKLKASIGAEYTPAFSSMLKTIAENMNGIVDIIKNLGIAMTAVFSGRLLESFATKLAANNITMAQSATVLLPNRIGGTASNATVQAAYAENTLKNAQAHEALTAATLRSARATELKMQVDATAAKAELRRLMILESSGSVMANDTAHTANKARATYLLTSAQTALTTATAASTAAQEANTIASNASALAQQRAATLTASATISSKLLSAAIWTVEGATKAASVAFTAIGGWIGVVVIALTTAVMWWSKYKKAKEEAIRASQTKDTAIETLEEEIKMLDKEHAVATKNIKALGDIKQKEVDKEKQRMLDRKKLLQTEIDDYESKNKIYSSPVIEAKKDEITKINREYEQYDKLMAERNAKEARNKSLIKPEFTVPKVKPEHIKEIKDLTHLYEKLADSQRRSEEALTNEVQAKAKNALASKKTELMILNEMNIISTRQRLEQEAQLEKEFAAANIAALEIQWGEAVKARQQAEKSSAVMVLSPEKKVEAEIRLNQTLTDETKKRSELESAISDEKLRAGKFGLELAKEDTKERAQLMSELYQLELQQQAKREKMYSDLDKASSTTDDISTQLIEDPYERQKAQIDARYQYEADAIQRNIELLKSTQQLEFEMMDDHYAMVKATAEAEAIARYGKGSKEHKQVMDNQLAADKVYEDNKLKMAQKNGKAIAALEDLFAKLWIKKEEDKTKTTKEGYRAQLGTVIQYADLAAGLFSELAASQDQSSRAGFEAAKAYSMGAAIVSTAAAVMSQLATPGPLGWVKAAAAAVMGGIQIANIAGTTYGGGGGSVSMVGGAFSGGLGGAADGGTVGGMIGAQYTSIQDSQTQESLTRIAGSLENASVAIGKVADGLIDIGVMFKDGSFMAKYSGSLVSAAVNMGYTSAWKSLGKTDHKESLGMAEFLAPGFGGSIVNILKIFGNNGPLRLKDTGFTLGMKDGNVVSKLWEYFESQKTSAARFKDSPEIAKVIDNALSGIRSTISKAAFALGTTADFSTAKAATLVIGTAGKSPEQIAKEVQKWMAAAADAMAKTVDGLKDYAFAGEKAFDALVRLATSLQAVNSLMLDLNMALLPASLESGNLAYKLIELMGGMEEFTTKTSDYISAMFTDHQQSVMKSAALTREVSIAFAEMGMEVPMTKDSFNALVQSLDISTEAGAQAFAALMSIAGAFGTLQDEIAKAEQALADYNNDLTERSMRLAGLEGGADLFALRIAQEEELQAALEGGMDTTQLLIVQNLEWAAAVEEATGVVTTSITSIIDAAKKAALDMIDAQIAIANAMKTIMTGPMAMLSPEAAYNQAQARFAALQGKTDLESLQALPEVANALLNASKAYNASGAGYQSDLAMVLNELARAAGIEGDPTLDKVDQQLNTLKEIRDAIQNGNAANIDQLTAVLGTGSPLLALIGTWSAATAAQLQAEKEAAAAQTQEKLNAALTAVAAAEAAIAKKSAAEEALATATAGKNVQLDLRAVAQTELDTIPQRILDQEQIIRDNRITGWETATRRAEKLAAIESANIMIDWLNSRDDVLQGRIDAANTQILAFDSQIQLANQAIAEANLVNMNLTSLVSQVDMLTALLNSIIASYIIPPALPSFATGSAYLPYDMTANVHAGEIIMDRASSDVLRKYGIPVQGSADNKELIAEVKALREEVRAGVRVQQAGFTGVIQQGEKQARSSETIANASRLAVNA